MAFPSGTYAADSLALNEVSDDTSIIVIESAL